jgi:hypothetical protein
MVNDVKNKGIDIAEIAGDDDTTGFGKLKGIYPDSQMIKRLNSPFCCTITNSALLTPYCMMDNSSSFLPYQC